jgi:dihydrofolate synthase/folylpolyglutamate synthase
LSALGRTLEDWLDYIGTVHVRSVDLGLERFRTVAERLDVLAPAGLSIIVAGTNGKGSTCMALEHLLAAAGQRVGTTLSPHVTRFNERVRIAGAELTDQDICEGFAAVEAARGDVPLTYFEFSALLALRAFREAAVDTAVLEVGLGGRLDAFNAVDADLAVVTSIGLDHQEYLGADLEVIGREKAGVFRPGRPVVLGSVTESVRAVAAELDCPVWQLGCDFRVDESAESWSYRADALDLDYAGLPRGDLAPVNCALAVTATAVAGADPRPGLAALHSVRLTGRMEQHRWHDLPVLLDVAHNPAGAQFLAGQLRQRYPGRNFVALYGALTDKDAGATVRELDGLVSGWLVIPTQGPRGQAAEDLAARLPVAAEPCCSIERALDRAVSLTGRRDGILVFGSFSAVEQARAALTSAPGSAAGSVAGRSG